MGWGRADRCLLVALAVVSGFILALTSPDQSKVPADSLPSLTIDANTAPMGVLGALPGLGPALSGRIVQAREVTPFQSMNDLERRVKGIGPAKADAIRPFLQFDPPSAP